MFQKFYLSLRKRFLANLINSFVRAIFNDQKSLVNVDITRFSDLIGRTPAVSILWKLKV